MQGTRRDFLKASFGTSTLLAFGGGVPGFLSYAAKAAAARGNGHGSVLVVVQLSGGNDGLNTVVPYEDDAYGRNRPTLRLPANRVLKLDSGLGFHPEMPAFQRLYQEGLLSIIQGVGYPNSTRDHDAAKRDWHTARPTESVPQTGWLGRTIDRVCDSGSDVPGVFVGQIKPPFSLHTERAVVPWLRSLDDRLLSSPGLDSSATLHPQVGGAAQSQPSAREDSLIGFLQSTVQKAHSSNQRFQSVLATAKTTGDAYPQFPLAQTLRSVAQLIRADLGIRIYFAELGGGEIGGFDTHAGQAINHGALLRELSESITAFVADLRRDDLLDSVLLMTFSEFGRTLSENGRRGTDHGAAAPVFLAGGRLKGGLVGTHPSLTELDNDAPKFHTDFRRVYATVLERWLGLDSQPALGQGFRPLDGVIA